MKTISIVIPVYNENRYIDKFIAQDEHDKKVKTPLLDNIFGRLGHTRSLILLYFVLLRSGRKPD